MSCDVGHNAGTAGKHYRGINSFDKPGRDDDIPRGVENLAVNEEHAVRSKENDSLLAKVYDTRCGKSLGNCDGYTTVVWSE